MRLCAMHPKPCLPLAKTLQLHRVTNTCHYAPHSTTASALAQLYMHADVRCMHSIACHAAAAGVEPDGTQRSGAHLTVTADDDMAALEVSSNSMRHANQAEDMDMQEVSTEARSAAWAGMVASWPREQLEPGLYVVGTPIGNLGDITLRALATLRAASVVLAEDTRHSRKLLNFYGIKADMLSYHAHNEHARVEGVVARLAAGEPMALVSDAGMPGISDPGHPLIVAAVAAGVKVIPVPGPCAFVAALVASGLPTTTITFVGFLPPKQGARRARLAELRHLPGTLALYAPPHGLASILRDMAEVLGPGRRVCVAREITKRHEEMFRSTLQGAAQEFSVREPRGEMCVVVEGASSSALASAAAALAALGAGTEGAQGAAWEAGSEQGVQGAGGEHAGGAEDAEQALVRAARPLLQQLKAQGVPQSAAAKQAARQLGVGKKALYELALEVWSS